MKAEKIINLLKRLKEEITVIWRNQEFKIHKSKTYKDAYEGENKINYIIVSYLEELTDMTLTEKLQYAVDNYRCEVKYKSRFFEGYKTENKEKELFKVTA